MNFDSKVNFLFWVKWTINQHWFKNGARRTITWSNDDHIMQYHMASADANKLKASAKT